MTQAGPMTHPMLRNARLPRASWRRCGLIVVAVCSLAVSLATRYCVLAAPDNHSETTVQSHAPAPKRQHLDNDGLHWTAPAATFILFKPGRAHIAVLPAVRPATNLYAGDCLHNRPPPSC